MVVTMMIRGTMIMVVAMKMRVIKKIRPNMILQVMMLVTMMLVTMMMVTMMMVTLMMRVMRMMRVSVILQMDNATERLKMAVDSSTLRMGEVGKINKSFANSTSDVRDNMTVAQEKAKL